MALSFFPIYIPIRSVCSHVLSIQSKHAFIVSRFFIFFPQNCGVKINDFIIAVDGEDVKWSSHEIVVAKIREPRDLNHLQLALITPKTRSEPGNSIHGNNGTYRVAMTTPSGTLQSRLKYNASPGSTLLGDRNNNTNSGTMGKKNRLSWALRRRKWPTLGRKWRPSTGWCQFVHTTSAYHLIVP